MGTTGGLAGLLGAFPLAEKLLSAWEFDEIGFVSSFLVGEVWGRMLKGLRENPGKPRSSKEQEACRQRRPAVTPPQAPLGRWRRAERRKERPGCGAQ